MVYTRPSLDSGAIGPVTVMPSFTATFGALSASLHGLVISSLLLSATVASLFAGALSDSLGRPRAIAIGALVFAIGAALEAGAVTLGMLIAGRLIVGAGEGIFLSTIVVWVICLLFPYLVCDPANILL
jgi:MFS family permease